MGCRRECLLHFVFTLVATFASQKFLNKDLRNYMNENCVSKSTILCIALLVCFGISFSANVSFAVDSDSSQLPLVYEGKTGIGTGKHIVFLAGDHEYRSEETLPALARMLAINHGFKCTVLFTVDPETGEIDPAADNLPGTEVLAEADLAVIFLRFKNLPDAQMRPIADYLNRGGPIVGLRTSTHAFKIPVGAKYSKYDYQYNGDEYSRGFGRQVLGESWSGHYGKNHVMATRLDIPAEAKSHPIMTGVEKPWAQSGGYWTVPIEGSQVLAYAQPLENMSPDSKPAVDKKPCPGVWTRNYKSEDGKTEGRVFTTTYGASEDLLDNDFRRMMLNSCLWTIGMENEITDKLNIDFVGGYNPATYQFGGHRRGVKPLELSDLQVPVMPTEKPIIIPERKKKKKNKDK